MGKQYTKVTNEQRKELINLIYEKNYSISKAAEMAGIYYPTAKAINKVYKKEKRVQKRNFRYRAKKEDHEIGIIRNKIPVEKLATLDLSPDQQQRVTCGVRLKLKDENLRDLKDEASNFSIDSQKITDATSDKSLDFSPLRSQQTKMEVPSFQQDNMTLQQQLQQGASGFKPVRNHNETLNSGNCLLRMSANLKLNNNLKNPQLFNQVYFNLLLQQQRQAAFLALQLSTQASFLNQYQSQENLNPATMLQMLQKQSDSITINNPLNNNYNINNNLALLEHLQQIQNSHTKTAPDSEFKTMYDLVSQ
eukprot:403367673